MSKDVCKVIDGLGEKKFLKILTKITKINNIFLDDSLDGAGLHQVYNKGYLNIHTDFASHHKNLKCTSSEKVSDSKRRDSKPNRWYKALKPHPIRQCAMI